MSGIPLFPDGRSLLRGVRVLARGAFARIGEGSVREGTYWDPRPDRLQPPTEARFGEHAERLRSALLATLSTELDPGGGNLLSLSGGIDSSSLLGLAGGTLGLPVSAISLVPDRGPKMELERRYLASATEHAPLVHHLQLPMGHGSRPEWARDSVSPGFLVVHPVLHLLPRAAAETDVRVLFGGEFGDEVGGSKYTLPDWARATPASALLRPSRLPRGGRDVVRWLRTRVREASGGDQTPYPAMLADWVHPRARGEYRAWRVDVGRAASGDPRPLRTLALRAGMDGFTAMNWEATSELGIRRVIPYFTRDMLELAFDCHPNELIGPGFRRLQRAALAEDVPRANLWREDPGVWAYPDPSNMAWEGTMPPWAAATVDPGWFPRPSQPVEPISGLFLWSLVRFAEALSGVA
jgi:asparagine synthetase B (glutamine-hydrolysing)